MYRVFLGNLGINDANDRLDEIVDGNNLINNGEIIEFARNKLYKWRAPMAMTPLLTLVLAYNNQWSWDRRAIIVDVDGLRLPASMAGMPHEEDSIENGMAGHFDVLK